MSWIKRIYMAVIYLFLYLPIVVLIVFSFNESQYSLTWQGASTQWYKALFSDNALWKALQHSLVLGISSASLATILGTLAAVCLYRYHFFGKKITHAILFALIIVPDIVLGIALLIWFNWLAIPMGFISLLLAHTTFCLPFVTTLLYVRLTHLDKSLLEAARDLGANEGLIFRKILLPLLRSGIMATFLLSFTLSFDDILVSYFVASPDYDILPLHIYSLVIRGLQPEVNALCALVLSFTLIIVLLAQWLLREKR